MDRVGELDHLVRLDEESSAVLTELDALLDRVAAIRARLEEVTALFAAASAQEERLAAAVREAETDVSERSAALAVAEADLGALSERGDRDRLAAARRLEVRARDALAMAEKHLNAAGEAQQEHRARVDAARREVPQIVERAGTLAADLRGRPGMPREAGREPEGDLGALTGWASGARAALVVARSSAAAQREAVIRQANELASALLGEAQTAASAATVAARVERALRA